MIGRWRKLHQSTIFETPIFSLRKDRVCPPDARHEHDFFTLVTRDWINVIPVTRDGRVVIVRQWRNGVDAVTLEIPGGMIDPSDPSPAAAAARELREETGYVAERLVHIGTVDPNPAIQTNACHTFLAEGAVRVSGQTLDHAEEIEVDTVALGEVPALIQQGVIRHALVVAAFYHYERHRSAG